MLNQERIKAFLHRIHRGQTQEAKRDVLEYLGPLLRQARGQDGGTLFHAMVEASKPLEAPFWDSLRVFSDDMRAVIDVVDDSSKRRTALAAACAAGKNAALVQRLLAMGANPSVVDNDGNPPLVLLGKAKANDGDDRVLIEMLNHLVHGGARLDQPGAKVRRRIRSTRHPHLT